MSEFPLWSELIRQAFPSQNTADAGRIVSVVKPGEKYVFREAIGAYGWPIGLRAAAIKTYAQNEKNNDHTGNALFLTRLFGTPLEIAAAQKLWDIRAKEGGIDTNKHQSLVRAVDVLHSKYHRRLLALKEENEDSDSDYQEYFKTMLQKHGYDSPADIPDDKKDDFFNAVDKGYSAKNEEKQPVNEDERVKSYVSRDGLFKGTVYQQIKTYGTSKTGFMTGNGVLELSYRSTNPRYDGKVIKAIIYPSVKAATEAWKNVQYKKVYELPAFGPREAVDHESLTEVEDPVVPMRMQAAMVIAKALGSVKATGQFADFKAVSGSPEALVNQALRVWMSGSHTPEGWALGAKMLKLAKDMGIKWDYKLIGRGGMRQRLQKLGLEEAEEVAAVTNSDKLSQRQAVEKETLALRHNREKSSQTQRDNEEKIRKQASTSQQAKPRQ